MPGGPQQRKREAAIAALLGCPTMREAASKAGVSARTLRTWLADPSFRDEYQAARRRIVEAAVEDLQKSMPYAVATLKKHLLAERPADAVRAALGILDRALKGSELLDLEARIAELERRQKGRR
jgi:hypothetical protein